VPGKPDESPLIEAIRYQDEFLRMPPKTPLPPEQVADFEAWVKMGAPDPRDAPAAAKPPVDRIDIEKARDFWSFRPVADPPVPAVQDPAWPKNDVDRFVLARLEAVGLAPVPVADKPTLIRRATYDLTGLPPTPEEVDAFLADGSPAAFEVVVDRLLASPAYGERWGRHWLDLVRYADTAGCNSDFPVPSAYKYRNYVITAFNQDKPYDRFLDEQVAGDLLAAGEPAAGKHERIIATGYLAISRRFGSSPDEFHLTIDDTIDNIGKAFLGLSVSCARCHDHKFDPIPQSDYYALYGILDSSRYAYPGLENARRTHDFVALGSPDEAEALRRYEAEAIRLEGRLRKLKKEKDSPQDGRTLEQVNQEFDETTEELKRLDSRPPAVDKAYAVGEGDPHDAHIFKKGDPAHPGAEVPRGFLQVLGGGRLPDGPRTRTSGRLELAAWLTDTGNPLTARVMVNRIWLHHFGKGIVPTPNDFGTRGRPPTHPELLDYLASRFVEDGWSIKAMHRRLMLSRTYQLAGFDDSHNASVDPANDLLWRRERRRLSAEEIRDAMLAVAGTLDRSAGGPYPLPPESEFRYTQHVQFVAPDSFDTPRRTVYQIQQRLRRRRILEVFDGADPNVTTPALPLSTTALQALYLMNDPFVHDRADELAGRLEAASPDEEGRIDLAYRLAFGRPATAGEVAAGRAYLAEARPAQADAGVPPDQQPRTALDSLMRVLLSSNEFLFVD
jgi:hypothetical protein